MKNKNYKRSIQYSFLPIKTILFLLLSFFAAETAGAQCDEEFNWASWTQFADSSATGVIQTGGEEIEVTVSTDHPLFSISTFIPINFPHPPPQAPILQANWTGAPGELGTTTICFSEPVSVPVLYLSSVGRPEFFVTLEFSKPYIPLFHDSPISFPSPTSITGNEGSAVLLFPCVTDCLIITSTTQEFSTLVTVAINPPLFDVVVSGDMFACDSATAIASGGVSYVWSGGHTPNEAFNTFFETGNYIVTATDAAGCAAYGCHMVDVGYTSFAEHTVEICEGETHDGYSASGTYEDVFTNSSGCDSVRTLHLTVNPVYDEFLEAVICQGELFEGYGASGMYTDLFDSAEGCDSVRTLHLTVNPVFQLLEEITLCAGEVYDFHGLSISSGGIYIDTLLTARGCDSVIVLDVTAVESGFLGEDATICVDDEIWLTGPSENTRWFDNSISQTKRITESGVYWATNFDRPDCLVSDTVVVQFKARAFVPNVFSPNADGINDYFAPHFSETNFASYQFSIFDRWGNQVYFTTIPGDRGWDGRHRGQDCATGVYAYFIETDVTGCGKSVERGSVLLVR
ncbi:MAG: gliding motility-associated C-terminal domain-containing protein [Saprospiraceae bacterium]